MGGSSSTDPSPTALEQAQTDMAKQWYNEFGAMSEEFLAKSADNIVGNLARSTGGANRGTSSADAAQIQAKQMEGISPANPTAQATNQATSAINADAAVSQVQTQTESQGTDQFLAETRGQVQSAINQVGQTNTLMGQDNALASLDSTNKAHDRARKLQGLGLAAGGLVSSLYEI